ncbi:sal-like protein 4 [Penaeus indicus]|uniref:sal-like protein 4 n=1 Tax=Penaeus indicus TaxID=29960 RepID=UPI00300CB930
MVEESVTSSAWNRDATDLGLCDAPQGFQGPPYLSAQEGASDFPPYSLPTSFHDPIFPMPQDHSSWESLLLDPLQEVDLLSLPQTYTQFLPLTPPLTADAYLSAGSSPTTPSVPSPTYSCPPAPSSSQSLVGRGLIPSMYPSGTLTPPVSPAPTVIATNLAAQQVRVITPSEVLPLSGKPVVAKQTRQKFPCSDCGKLYTQRRARDLHMLVHTGERPFVCDRCGAAFNRPGTLKVHRITEVCLRKQRRAFDQRASARAGRTWAHRTSMAASK